MKPDFDEFSFSLRSIADDLVPFTFPKNHPRLEAEISFLKTRQIMIDGYEIICYFSRADYDEYYQETLQLLSVPNSFLPFHFVSKVARKFLGSHGLYLTEIIKNNKKLYLWTAWVDKQGKPTTITHQKYVEECNFGEFNYRYVLPNQMNFH